MKRTVRARERTLVTGLLILMALVSGGLPTGIPEALADSIAFTGVVIGIEDGDTLTVLRNKARFNLNLAAVDAPELNQPYGQEAKRLVAALVKGKVVTVRVYITGRQGRVTGEVWLKDRRNLATELVRAGLAWVKRGAVEATDLTELEDDAKDARRGLWKDIKPGFLKDEEPIPPWEWRNGRHK